MLVSSFFIYKKDASHFFLGENIWVSLTQLCTSLGQGPQVVHPGSSVGPTHITVALSPHSSHLQVSSPFPSHRLSAGVTTVIKIKER